MEKKFLWKLVIILYEVFYGDKITNICCRIEIPACLMQKSFYVLAFCLVNCTIGFSQVHITCVDKSSGNGIEGVALYLKIEGKEKQAIAASNANGIIEATFETFPVIVVTSHVGFTEREFEITSPGQFVIELEPGITQLEGVVVTGQYEQTSIRQSVHKVRVLDKERIKAQGTTKLQDILSTELNIRFSQDPALGVSTISMQGLSGQNVKVLLDGVPMVGRQGTSNAIDLNQINVNTIERIEIVEGPMSTIYGADALAGVINIITKKPSDEKLSGSVKIHEESIGDEYSLFKEGTHQENINVGYNWKSWYAFGDVGHTYSGGWQGNAEGREKQWNPKKQWLGDVGAGIQKENWNASYRVNYLNENIYNPAQFNGNEALDQNYITTRFIHQVQVAKIFSDKADFNGAVSYTDYSRKTQTVTVNAATGEETLALGPGLQDETKYDGITLRGAVQYKISSKVSLQPGYDINLESGTGGRLKEGTNNIGDYAFFLSAEIKPFPFLNIRPGVRMVHNSVYQAPPVIPSINTKIVLSPKHDLRLAYGRGFRAPSLRELYFDFFDASHSIEGNPDLEAELSHSFNASWNWYLLKTASLSYTSIVSGFYNSVDNMIGYGLKPSDNTVTTYINIEKYKTQGITWNNSIQTNALNLSAGVAYTGRYNQLTDVTNDNLPYFTWSPEVNTSISYSFSKIGLTTSLYYKYTGRTPFYEVEDGSTHLAETDSFHWADVTVQKAFLKQLNLTVGVRNLFDVTQVNSTSLATGTHNGNGSNTMGSGRSFFATLTINFVQ